MDGWVKKLLQKIRQGIGRPDDRTNFQSIEDMIGIPDAANSCVDDILRTGYDSSSQARNEDGAIIERLEDIREDVCGGNGIASFPSAANAGDGVSIAEVLRGVLTSLVGGDDYDGYTNISNSANASVDAIFQKFATLFAANGVNIFNPTIQGAARTDLELALSALATYISPSGAAMSSTVDPGGSTRTNIEEILEDIGSMLAGTNGISTFPAAANIGDGISLAESIRAILTSLVGGDDYDGYTNINNSANTSIDAIFQKFAVLFAADGVNVFNPTIQGSARTDLELALAAFATYITASGAALSIQVNNQTARDNLEQVWEDFLAVVGCDGSNVFDPAISGGSQTTVEAAFAALASIGLSALEGETADFDEFDVADADADTERWDPGYLNGTEGGSSDINTTVAGKCMVKVDPDATPTAAMYGVGQSQPITSKFVSWMADVDATFGGSPASQESTGLEVSNSTYDVNNRVYIQVQSGGSGDRITCGAIFNSVNQTEAHYSTSDTEVSFKVTRQDNVWRCYYSLTQYPDEDWVLLKQFEDAGEHIKSEAKCWMQAYTPGAADGDTTQGDFDNFRVKISSKGIMQAISGDFDSSYASRNDDGSVIEILKSIMDDLRGTNGIASFPAAANPGDGVSMAEVLRAIITSMTGGDDYDGYTNISNGAVTSIDAIVQAICTMLGIDGANTFDPAMFGGSQTTLESALAAIGNALGAELDGTPDLYDVLVTGLDSSSITNNFDGGLIEVVKAGLEKDTAGVFDADTDSNEAIREELDKVYKEQADVAVNTTAVNGSDTSIFDLNSANTTYNVESLWVKCADPGANTITFSLEVLINDVATVVNTFDVTNAGANPFTSYYSLMDMFGIPNIVGDDVRVYVRCDAGGPYAVTGQYSYSTAVT